MYQLVQAIHFIEIALTFSGCIVLALLVSLINKPVLQAQPVKIRNDFEP